MSDQRQSPSLQSVNSTDSFGSLGSIDSVASPVRKTRPFNHDSNSMLASAEISAHGIGSKAHDMPSPTDTNHNHDAPCEYSSGCFSPSSAPTRKHPRFYLDSRTFEIKLDDGTLYRVFRQTFETHSTAFAAQYLGSSVEDEPIALSGVLAKDLDRFLSLIYPSELATCELSTADEWLSVLRLAHKWSFPAICARAIREIHLTGSAVDKIAAAREFADIEELRGWLLPAFKEACSAPRWLRLASLQDAERLGAGTILAIAQMREEARDAEEGMYDVEQAVVVAGLAPDPTPVKRTRTATQADVLRHMFSGRPASLTDVTVGEASWSASAREPLSLVSAAPTSSPRMPPHHEDVSWPPPMAFRDRQSTRRGAPGLPAESVPFSNPATGSCVINKPEKRTAPPPAVEAHPAAMREAQPPSSSFEAWLIPSAGASLLNSAAPRSLGTNQAMALSLEEAEMLPRVGSALFTPSVEPPASLSAPVFSATREPSPHPLSKGQKKKLRKKMRMKKKVEADMDKAHAKGAAAKEAPGQEEEERQGGMEKE